MNYLLKLSYDGTNYCGFQVQPNGRSVAAVFQDALEAVLGCRPDIKGCSRTDAGVHALGFMLNNSSYFGEILRAGLNSVPKGQLEAARSTGMSALQAMTHIQVPQAVRNVLPDLISNTLEVVKLTSIAAVVALPELLFQARQAQSLSYNATPIMAAAALYFLMLWPLVRLLSRLENRAVAAR